MEETRKCPSCGMENPINRVTCQVCHGKMNKKSKAGSEDAPEPEKGQPTSNAPNPFDSTSPGIATQPPKPEKVKKTVKDSTPKQEPPQKVIKRRRRKTVKPPTDQLFFTLIDGKVRAVTTKLIVSRPIKMSALPPMERAYIAFLNKNIDLLTG